MASRRLQGIAVAIGVAGLGCVTSCGIRAPRRIDVAALVSSRGPVEARRELEIEILANPRDVGARLALAALDEKLGRPGAALAQLETVHALGGPLGTRWHDDDRARLGRLLAARGRVRLGREAPTGYDDLKRARGFGASINDQELIQARIAIAVTDLRHVDTKVRARGQAVLAELASSPLADKSWVGARAKASPADRGRFGAWLWSRGAKRAAWEELSAWHASLGGSSRDPVERCITAECSSQPLAAEMTLGLRHEYLRALAWWSPVEAPQPPASEPIAESQMAVPSREPLVDAVTRYLRARGHALPKLATILAAYRRDPSIADRIARDVVAEASDAAAAHAALGMLFQALADPARARAAWQAAVDASPEPAFVRGLAESIAYAGDPDAALNVATTAAAASGDPAVVWVEVAQVLEAVGKDVHALEAARSALDLAGPETVLHALDIAIAASRSLGRTPQAEALEARRERLTPVRPGPDREHPTGAKAALEAYTRHATASTVAGMWVASRVSSRDVAIRAALRSAVALDDPRRRVVEAELVALAGDRDPAIGRRAVNALR